MKIVLTKDVNKVGKRNDVVKVKNGFAKNYLIHNNLATVAKNGILKHHKMLLHKEEIKLEEIKKKAAKFVPILEKSTIKLRVKAGQKGKLFGSVTSEMISKEVSKIIKFDIDKENIDLLKPIKEVGDYEAHVKLSDKISSKVKIQVSAKKGSKKNNKKNKKINLSK